MFLQIFGTVAKPGAFGYAIDAGGFGLFLDNITFGVPVSFFETSAIYK